MRFNLRQLRLDVDCHRRSDLRGPTLRARHRNRPIRGHPYRSGVLPKCAMVFYCSDIPREGPRLVARFASQSKTDTNFFREDLI
jgi:hypothetical protein